VDLITFVNACVRWSAAWVSRWKNTFFSRKKRERDADGCQS